MDKRTLVALLLWSQILFAYLGMVVVANFDALMQGAMPTRFFGAPLLVALAFAVPVSVTWFFLRRLVFRPARMLSRDVRALLESRSADAEITLPARHAMGSLPDSVGALAVALRASRREIRSAMASATAQINEQKTWLEVILQGLTEGVLVCNRNHQMLLYNQSAVTILNEPERVGLGRPLFDVVSKAPVMHTLDRLEWRRCTRGESQADLSESFVCTNAEATRILQGRMALMLDPRGETSAYLITLVDISADVETLTHVDAIRRALTMELRGAVGNLRAAAETVDAHPEMATEVRRRFEHVMRAESEQLSRRLEELAAIFRGHALGRWPMSDIFSSDLISCVARRLEDLPNLRLVPVGQPLWVQGDSLSLVRVLECLLRELHVFSGADTFHVETLLGDRRIYLDLSWKGPVVPAKQLDQWLDISCGEELGHRTVRDVLDRHGIELWSQQAGLPGEALLRLPLIVPKRPQFLPEGERLPPRPEFYDFGIMREHEGTPELADVLLADLTFVVFDCEMTGLDPVGGDEIISIAGVRVVKGRVLTGETFERLINPGFSIPAASIRFHGITDDQVQDKPPVTEVLPLFKAFVGDAVMVAHNAAFDMKFISMKETQCGVSFNNPVLDTLLLSVMVEDEEEDHSLDALLERYGIRISGRHTALGDAVATAELLVRLIERLQSQGFNTFGEVMRSSNMAAQLRQREHTLSHQNGNGSAVGV
ncbi:histidine kinase [Ectothiorhodospira shaposhnikovii]|uniref:exonuclease domain-containing protein n=1 Tax=Ectothiorhodospira shaposhnikovii TaxID=1054 RepID=UPI001908566D|nr:histidine kinase [Ectothiorhodospira shaposhnikovii]